MARPGRVLRERGNEGFAIMKYQGFCGTFGKRQWISAGLVDLTPGNLKVSNVAALLSKKRMFVLVRREWRAFTRSSFPLRIQKPSKIAGIRGTVVARLKRLYTVSRLSSGTRVKGQTSGLPVVPLIPYQQWMKNLRPVLVEAYGQAVAPSGSLREVGLKE